MSHDAIANFRNPFGTVDFYDKRGTDTMADILKDSIAGLWDIKAQPEKLGWQQPIIPRKGKLRVPLRMEDIMIDALVQPKRHPLNRYYTPLFSHGKKT